MGSIRTFLGRNKKNEERPRLDIPRSGLEIFLDLASLIGLLAMVFIAAYYWGRLPDVIPVHYALNGQPDGWGSPNSILVFVLIGLATASVLYILTFFPQTYNYPVKITSTNVEVQYRLARTLLRAMTAAILMLFSYMEWQMIHDAMQSSSSVKPHFALELIVYNCVFLLPLIAYFLAAFRHR